MSQYQKSSHKILNNLLLTPVDGYSTRIFTDNDECEISFEFGGLKGIMEEMDSEEPVLSKCYEDEIFSTKSSSPMMNSYLFSQKHKYENLPIYKNFPDFDSPCYDNAHIACENREIQEITNFDDSRAFNLNFLKTNPVSQPVRRKKIKISQVLKKKWKTKVPSFVENQKIKLISKINLIKNQNINKYKNESDQKMCYEEKFFEGKGINRRCKIFLIKLLVSHTIPKKETDPEIFNRKSSKSQKYSCHLNKFNSNEVADFEQVIHLNNRQNFYEHNRPYFINSNNLQMKNHSVNTNNCVNYDPFSYTSSLNNFSSKIFPGKKCR